MKYLKICLFILLGIFLLLVLDYVRINIRYFSTRSNYESGFSIYGNKKGDVPQGLTYSEKYNVVLQTSYSKEVSKLFIIDFEKGKLIKELKLINRDNSNNLKHVGGVTTDNEKIWITNDYEVDIYDLEEVMNTKEDKIKPTDEIKLPIRGDFCYFSDNILWIGEFYLKPFYDVEGSIPKLNGYKLKDDISFNKPDYTLYLPKAVQGMVILDDEVLFTQSFTYLVNSNLSIYKNILNKNNFKFSNSNKISTIKLPPMAEGMFYKDGYLYILFESSSSKYSLADPKIGKVIKYKIKKLIK